MARFQVIPEHVVKNEELRDKIVELICDNNFIKKVPPEISTCEQLVRVDVSGNLIKKLPPGVVKLALLEELNCSDNQLKVCANTSLYPEGELIIRCHIANHF